MCHVQAFR